MDLQTIGNAIANWRSELKSIREDIAEIRRRIVVLENRPIKTNAVGREYEDILCPENEYLKLADWDEDRYRLPRDTIHKTDEEVIGPQKKRSYE